MKKWKDKCKMFFNFRLCDFNVNLENINVNRNHY